MSKKIISIIVVLVLAVVIYGGYKLFLAPKAVEGEKEVTIKIVVEEKDINKSFTYNTDTEFLYDLMKEQEEEIGATLEDSDYGPMVTGMGGYVADPSNNEFFLIKVNGEDATTGVKEIPVKDGDTYTFELSKW